MRSALGEVLVLQGEQKKCLVSSTGVLRSSTYGNVLHARRSILRPTAKHGLQVQGKTQVQGVEIEEKLKAKGTRAFKLVIYEI